MTVNKKGSILQLTIFVVMSWCFGMLLWQGWMYTQYEIVKKQVQYYQGQRLVYQLLAQKTALKLNHKMVFGKQQLTLTREQPMCFQYQVEGFKQTYHVPIKE